MPVAAGMLPGSLTITCPSLVSSGVAVVLAILLYRPEKTLQLKNKS